MRRQIGELRAGSGIGVGADDDAERRRIQMKQRMDMAAAGNDRHGAAGFEKSGVLHPQMADAQMRGDRFRLIEVKTRVDARPFEDVKGAGELVLMNVRGSLEPEQNLDIKTRVIIDDQLRLAKPRLGLKRLLIVEQELFDQRRERPRSLRAAALRAKR